MNWGQRVGRREIRTPTSNLGEAIVAKEWAVGRFQMQNQDLPTVG